MVNNVTSRRGFVLGAAAVSLMAAGKPIRSSLGADGAVRGESGWQNPYVTDGLIAMWDGEWNAGQGVHDSSATTWTNLVSDSIFGDAVSDALCAPHTWTDKSCYNTSYPNNRYFQCFKVSNTRESAGEIVCTESVIRLREFEYKDNWNGFRDVQADVIIGNYRNVRQATFFCSNITSSGTMPFADYTFNGSATIDPTNTTSYHVSKNAFCCVNGGSQLNGTSRWSSSRASFDDYFLYGYNAIVEGFCYRIYSRSLTDAERAANYAVDKERFGL